MGVVVLLRIAAALAAVQGIAHGMLFVTAKPRSDAEAAVIAAMRESRFFAGGSRSYWDLYFGYGLIAAAVCLVEAALLWQLTRVVQVQPTFVRPIVALFVVANLGHALVVWRYFAFPIPILFDALVAACLVATFVGLSPG
jgi:hypothetical protein